MSTLLPLTNDERSRLQRLNQQKEVVFALKKLFLNVVADKPFSVEVQELAAERIALEFIKQAFHDLEVMRPDNQNEVSVRNIV